MIAAAPAPVEMPPGRRVRFYGGNHELFGTRSTEALIAGPAGTGKTMACLFKMFLAAEKYPGMRGLIVRKTRESLTEAALVTWETKVVPELHPCLSGPQRRMRQVYRFLNGSEIVVGGLDKAQKVMSTEYDLIYVQEAIELAENDWESLTTRLRNARMPYQQLLADTNPDRPTHWLKRRCDRGATRLLESRHEDNPTVIDPKTGQPTPDGAKYLAKLDALTGPRKPRLRYGRWVQAEGVVYEAWDTTVHLIDRFPIPADWPRFLSVDFGYTNPFVCQWHAMDPDGRLYLYREIYRTGRLVSEHGLAILRAVGAWDSKTNEANWYLAREPAPAMVICDTDAEDRATLAQALGLYCRPADKAVALGIQSVNERLAVQPDGKPRLFVMRDSLIDRDEKLAEAGQPASTVEEFDSYVWSKSVDGRPVKEEPVKLHDHGMDATRYICHTLATRGFTPLTPTTVSTGGGGEFGDELRKMAGGTDRDDDNGDSLFGRMTN